MKEHAQFFVFILVFLSCFAVYCWALLDWMVDYRTGVYANDHWEAFYESLALIIYTALGIRFIVKRLNHLNNEE